MFCWDGRWIVFERCPKLNVSGPSKLFIGWPVCLTSLWTQHMLFINVIKHLFILLFCSCTSWVTLSREWDWLIFHRLRVGASMPAVYLFGSRPPIVAKTAVDGWMMWPMASNPRKLKHQRANSNHVFPAGCFIWLWKWTWCAKKMPLKRCDAICCRLPPNIWEIISFVPSSHQT